MNHNVGRKKRDESRWSIPFRPNFFLSELEWPNFSGRIDQWPWSVPSKAGAQNILIKRCSVLTSWWFAGRSWRCWSTNGRQEKEGQKHPATEIHDDGGDVNINTLIKIKCRWSIKVQPGLRNRQLEEPAWLLESNNRGTVYEPLAAESLNFWWNDVKMIFFSVNLLQSDFKNYS